MKLYEIRVTRLTVAPEDEPIFSEMATHIEIKNAAAGEYLQIAQQYGHIETGDQQILISPEEWPKIKEAIETLMKDMRE